MRFIVTIERRRGRKGQPPLRVGLRRRRGSRGLGRASWPARRALLHSHLSDDPTTSGTSTDPSMDRWRRGENAAVRSVSRSCLRLPGGALAAVLTGRPPGGADHPKLIEQQSRARALPRHAGARRPRASRSPQGRRPGHADSKQAAARRRRPGPVTGRPIIHRRRNGIKV